jgi:hypothetical protein
LNNLRKGTGSATVVQYLLIEIGLECLDGFKYHMTRGEVIFSLSIRLFLEMIETRIYTHIINSNF